MNHLLDKITVELNDSNQILLFLSNGTEKMVSKLLDTSKETCTFLYQSAPNSNSCTEFTVLKSAIIGFSKK